MKPAEGMKAALPRVLLRAAPGVALLAALVGAVGPEEIATHLTGLDAAWLPLAAALYTGSLLVRGLRLWFMTRVSGYRCAWTEASAITVFSLSLNNFLPFRLGDVTRLYLLSTSMGLRFRDGLLISVAERWFDVAVLLSALLAGLSLSWWGQEGAGLASSLPLGGTFLVLMALLAAGAGLGLWPLSHRLVERVPGLPPQAAARLETLLDTYAEAVNAFLRPVTLLTSFALTTLIWSVLLLEYAVLFRAFGVSADIPLLVPGFCLFMFSFAVNVVPGQVGTFEALFIAAFSVVGATNPDKLLAIALGTHVVNTVFLTVLGAIAYLRLQVTWPDLRRQWRQAQAKVLTP